MVGSKTTSLPSLRGLHALTQLARAGSLSAAAGHLGVTRSALSHRIGDLENQLGVALVRRDGRTLVLTDDGETLLATVGDAVERIEAAVLPLQRRRFELRLSTVATFASLWLLPRVGRFRALHPAINLMVATTQRVVDFEREDIDCAIRHGSGEWRGLTSTLLFHETLVPVAAPDVAEVVSAAPAIRARARFTDWSRWCAASGESSNVAAGGLVVENRAQALEAALGGAGVALMDASYVEQLIALGRLRALGPTVDLPEGYWFVHRPRPRNERLVRTFRDWLLGKTRASGCTERPFDACPGSRQGSNRMRRRRPE